MTDAVIKYYGGSSGLIKKICTSKSNKNTGKINGSSFKLKEAPNPSDINWQNMGISLGTKIKNRTIANLLSLVLVVISFFCILGLKYVQKYFSKKNDESNTKVSTWGFRLVSLAVAFIILVINSLIAMAMKKLTEIETHSTNTTFFKSMTYKIVLVVYS